MGAGPAGGRKAERAGWKVAALAGIGLVGSAPSGCAEEPAAIGPGVHEALNAAVIASVGRPGPQDLPFGQALVGFSQALGRLHAFDEDADAAIAHEVLALAGILERMPAAGAEPELRRYAALMRGAMGRPDASMEDTKRALSAAATALFALVRTAYHDAPAIAASVRDFAGSVSAIDTTRTPPDRAAAVTALVRAERALAAMYAANVVPLPS
jgi:hypothetical protein